MTTLTLEWQEAEHRHTFVLPEDRAVTLGRHNCDITFPYQTISRQHASILPKQGVHFLHNLSRVNTITLKDGRKLSEGQTAALRSGDSFRLGPVTVQVIGADAPGQSLKIECANCGRLNEYTPEDQCIYCGRNLSSGKTIVISE